MAFQQPIDGNDIDPNSIERIHIAPNAVGRDELANNSVGSAQIESSAIGENQLANKAITTTKISPYAITTPLIAVGAIIADRLAANAVTAQKLAADAITAKHTITGALIQTLAATNRGIKIVDSVMSLFDNAGNLMMRLTPGTIQLAGSTITGWANQFLDMNLPSPLNANIPGSGVSLRPRELFLIGGSAAGPALSLLMPASGAYTSVAELRANVSRLIGEVELGSNSDATTVKSNRVVFSGSLPESNWQTADPLTLDNNGVLYKWKGSSERPRVYTASVANGTAIVAGAFRNLNIPLTGLSRLPAAVELQFTNFPAGSATLVPRLNNFTQTNVAVYVANTGAATATLGGDLSVRAIVHP